MNTKICKKCGMVKSDEVCSRCGGREYIDGLSDEQIDRILKRKNVAGGCMAVVLYLFFFTVAVLCLLAVPPLGIVILIVLFVQLIRTTTKKRDRNQVLIEQLLNAPMYDQFYMPVFQSTGVLPEEWFRQSGLFPEKWKKVEGSQVLQGERSGITFQMGNFSLCIDSKNAEGEWNKNVVYDGYMVSCRLSRTVYNQILISQKEAAAGGSFASLFDVSCGNAVILDTVLTEELKSALADFARRAGGCSFSIVGDRLYAVIPHGKLDYFAGDGAAAVRQTIWNDLHLQTEIIDALGRGGNLLQTSMAHQATDVNIAGN